MLAATVTAGLHYLAFMLMSGAAVTQLYLLKLQPSAELVKLAARVDRVYGIAAAFVLFTGLARMPVAHGGKGIDFYLHVGAFHAAATLFVIAALVSVVPTLRFLRWNRALVQGLLPSPADWAGLRKLVHVQLAAMALIALLMPAMARALF